MDGMIIWDWPGSVQIPPVRPAQQDDGLVAVQPAPLDYDDGDPPLVLGDRGELRRIQPPQDLSG
jgi:hypothetical protein